MWSKYALQARRVLGACLAGLLLSIQSEAAQARPTLILKNLRAEVEVVPEIRSDFAVSVDSNGSDDAAPIVTVTGSKATVESNINTEIRAYRSSLNLQPRMNVSLEKKSSHTARAIPHNIFHVVVHAPLKFDIKSNGNILGHVGPSQSLVIRDSGDGAWIVDDVDQDIEVYGHGGSDFKLSGAGIALIDMMGSGNLACGKVQRLLLNVYGSGDASVDEVQNDTEVTIGGMGDFTARSISGKMLVEMEDAGNVRVLEGDLSNLKVRTLDGLGAIDFGGTVQDADISIGARTVVRLRRVTGALKKSLRDAARLEIDGAQQSP